MGNLTDMSPRTGDGPRPRPSQVELPHQNDPWISASRVDSGLNDRVEGCAIPRPIRSRHASDPGASRVARYFGAWRATALNQNFAVAGPCSTTRWRLSCRPPFCGGDSADQTFALPCRKEVMLPPWRLVTRSFGRYFVPRWLSRSAVSSAVT
ncbi:hypothetical protein EAG_04490 [Camponotus floridanus]|uniref:Uncharacterized protein n=1 Tax=Camponotus floridanus TaxID=104421 RepID=E2AZJ3_CAMFO|nr:hypothetical protein EAG_04490 [Camponotus floridanus]